MTILTSKKEVDNDKSTKSQVSIILNRSREWGGKPKGSLRDSRVAEIPRLNLLALFFCVKGPKNQRGKK